MAAPDAARLPKRRFLVIGAKARTDGEFNLKDIPGTSGRLDVLARCVASGLLLSNGIRRDTLVYLLLKGPPGPPKIVRTDGMSVRNLNPDERSTASLLQQALRVPLESGGWLEALPGISVALADASLIDDEFKGLQRVLLSEDGAIGGEVPGGPTVLILGGHTDPDKDDAALLRFEAAARLSLGPQRMHADHCVAVLQNRLDLGRKGGSAALKLLGG